MHILRASTDLSEALTSSRLFITTCKPMLLNQTRERSPVSFIWTTTRIFSVESITWYVIFITTCKPMLLNQTREQSPVSFIWIITRICSVESITWCVVGHGFIIDKPCCISWQTASSCATISRSSFSKKALTHCTAEMINLSSWMHPTALPIKPSHCSPNQGYHVLQTWYKHHWHSKPKSSSTLGFPNLPGCIWFGFIPSF